MSQKETVGKLGSGLSVPMSLLLLIFFFLPWLRLTCSGQELGKASGLQLARGKMAAGDLVKNPGKMMGMSSTAKPAEGQKSPEEQQKELNETVKARPGFFLGLLAPALLLVIGLLGLKGGLGTGGSGTWLLILGVLGIITMILAANVEYSEDFIEKSKQDQAAKAKEAGAPAGMEGMANEMQKQMEEQMKKAFETRPTGILWGSLVLYILVVLCGLLNLLAGKIAVRPATAAAPAAPAAPAEPAQPIPPDQVQ